ncbi:MAG: toxin regulator [Lachnospiraceae bacterium]|nr:toxin regulator [Lachnospiraceae bacterium]
MKKKVVIMLLCSSLFLSGGCGSKITQEEYDSLKAEKETLETEIQKLEQEKQQLSADLSKKDSELSEINDEYESYKEKMVPYEKLSVAEAEAKTAEAEKKAEEAKKAKKEQQEAEAAAKAAAEAEASAAAEAENAKGYETGITYDQLARTPDDFIGQKVKFSGKVLQVMEGDDETQIRLAVDSNYDTVLYCGYSPSIVSSRILEDDIITVYGASLGLYSYTSALGGKITIPAVYVDKIEQ